MVFQFGTWGHHRCQPQVLAKLTTFFIFVQVQGCVWVWFWIYASRNANCVTTQQNAMVQSSASTLPIVRKLVALVNHLPLPSIAKHVMIVELNLTYSQHLSALVNCFLTLAIVTLVNTCNCQHLPFQTNATQLFNFHTCQHLPLQTNARHVEDQ